MLGKYFGMFKEKIEIEQDKPFEVNISVKKQKNSDYGKPKELKQIYKVIEQDL